MIPIYPANFPNIDQNADNTVIFQSINDGDSSQWRRTGHCSRCGNCCDDVENIFATVDGNNQPGGLEQVVPGKCAYFRWGADGLSQCVGRDTEYYRNGCVFAPTKIEHVALWSDCTYHFERL